MKVGFIAVLIVMGILFAFIMMAIMKLKSDIELQVRKKVDLVASKYEAMLHEKSEALKEIQLEQKAVEEPIEVQYSDAGYEVDESSLLMKQAEYRDESFAENYRLIKHQFMSPARQAMLNIIFTLDKEKKDFNVHEFKELLALFDCDLQYAMYTLESHEQLEVMQTVVQNSVAKKRILNRFVQSQTMFEFKNFLDYVKDYIFYNDASIYISANNAEPPMRDAPAQVVFIEDNLILEGYHIRFKDHLYDCSL